MTRERRLAVLTVGLDLTDRVPMVAAELFGYEGNRAVQEWQHFDPVPDYGLEGADPSAAALCVPARVRDGIRPYVDEDTALWLRLVSPYGFLGAVPWEGELVPDRAVPVFRVPDQLPVCAEQGRAGVAVIAVSSPAGSSWAAGYLRNHLARLTDVHVFADRETAHGLGELAARPDIHVHKPSHARAAYTARTGRGMSRFTVPATGRPVAPPAGRMWSDWIAEGLDGRAVRTLQVIVDAGWDHDRPILAVSPDPDQPVEIARCSYVTAEDIRRLADVLGAVTLVLGSPPDNPADTASRVIADGLGRQRSGPTLYTSLRDDPEGRELAAMYGSLGAADSRREQHWHPSFFAYLQPEYYASNLREGWPDSVGATVLPAGYRPSPIDERELTGVPSWVGTSERYVATELAALSRPADAPDLAAPYKKAYKDGKTEALNEIQDIVARHLEQS
jgi:hypothetical protein